MSAEVLSATIEDEVLHHDIASQFAKYSLDIIQSGVNWLRNRKNEVSSYASAGILAAGVVGPVAYDIVDSSPAFANTPHTRVLHKRINISLQSLMDDIHNYLPTEDGKHYTGSVGPTSAWLEASAGGFTTNCNNPYLNPDSKYNYQHYDLYTVGVGDKTCKGFFIPRWSVKPPYTEKAKPNEFKNDLGCLTNSVLRKAQVKSTETAKRISLNRKNGTITYNISPNSSSATGSRVEKVSLTQESGYTEAAITIES